MTEKTFNGYLIVNWKTGKMEIKKRRPKKANLSPFQILMRLELKVTVPDKKEFVVKGEIVLSEEKVSDIVIEEL